MFKSVLDNFNKISHILFVSRSILEFEQVNAGWERVASFGNWC